MNKVLFSMFLGTFLISCDKDDPVIPNEEELITTLNYVLTPVNGGSSITLSFKDLDGDGGSVPIITGGTLVANTTYFGTLEVLDESVSPAENITEEIEEESADHQFFFSSTISGLNISYDDEDTDGNPIGLKTLVSTGAAGSGTLTVTLRHEPNKEADGVAEGNITNAGGETDIEITFSNLSIQ